MRNFKVLHLGRLWPNFPVDFLAKTPHSSIIKTGKAMSLPIVWDTRACSSWSSQYLTSLKILAHEKHSSLLLLPSAKKNRFLTLAPAWRHFVEWCREVFRWNYFVGRPFSIRSNAIQSNVIKLFYLLLTLSGPYSLKNGPNRLECLILAGFFGLV